MRSFESFSSTKLRYRSAAALLLLAACSSKSADTSMPTNQDSVFMNDARAVYIYPGDVKAVPTIQFDLRAQYDKYVAVDQKNSWDENKDNTLAFKPNRYKLDFSEGDGSGTDTACERLRVPEGTKYVAATTDSGEESWIFLNERGDQAQICFDPGNNPETVLAWAGTDDR